MLAASLPERPGPRRRPASSKPPTQLGQVWLKPVGATEHPVEEGRRFDKSEEALPFSKRPSAVQVGDTMILYGIGARRLLAVFRVTGGVQEATEAEKAQEEWKRRWPWYVPSTNLTPRFGSHWWEHNLFASGVVEEFLLQSPDGAITATGGQTLGALNRGSDKIRLDEHFARFILDKMFLIEGSSGSGT